MITRHGLVKDTGKIEKNVYHRPAKLYYFTEKKYKNEYADFLS